MIEVPKKEMALAGAACAVCCAPLIVGAVVAAPAVAAAGGVLAVTAGATALVRRVRSSRPPEATS
mgnify:CR=1 FL=1